MSSHTSASARTGPALIATAVRAGQSVRFIALGASMWPSVRSGALVEVSPERAVRAGELAAYERGGVVVIHRVVRRMADGSLRVRGDAMSSDEIVPAASLLGAARVLRQPPLRLRTPTWADLSRCWRVARSHARRALARG